MELDTSAARWPQPRALIVLASFAFVVDLATKSMAMTVLAPGEPMNLLPSVNLTLGFNRGISFGLFPAESFAAAFLMTAVQITMVTGLVIWMWRAADFVTRTGLALVVGGAGGNIADRIRFGAVNDFVDLHVGEWHWPAFNAADTFIVLGVACLVASNTLASRCAGPAEQNSEA